ncbi:hypothetical protein GGI35DRAFT_459168 [Trichoderma velutinum]
MPRSSKTARPEANEEEPSYPPCVFTSSEEKRLYQRLKEAYMANYKTWDDEACEAWPHLVEHASLAPSTIGRITNHWITRNMASNKVTWAHYVALRVIYKGLLFKSKKIMRLIRAKYPRANFSSYAYHEEYTRPFKAEEGRVKPENTSQENNPNTALVLHDNTDEALGNVPRATLQAVKETISRFLNDEEDSQPAEETDGPYFARVKPKTVPLQMERETRPVIGEDETIQPRVPTSSSKRKRPAPENTDGRGNAEQENARKPRKQRKEKPSATTNNASDPPAAPDEMSNDLEAPAGSSNRRMNYQDVNLDRFIEALEKHGNILTENTKAKEKNTRVMEKHTELLEKLTEQLLNARRKRSR